MSEEKKNFRQAVLDKTSFFFNEKIAFFLCKNVSRHFLRNFEPFSQWIRLKNGRQFLPTLIGAHCKRLLCFSVSQEPNLKAGLIFSLTSEVFVNLNVRASIFRLCKKISFFALLRILFSKTIFFYFSTFFKKKFKLIFVYFPVLEVSQIFKNFEKNAKKR